MPCGVMCVPPIQPSPPRKCRRPACTGLPAAGVGRPEGQGGEGGASPATDAHGRAAGYWWERRGRNFTQARMPMTASRSHGENRTCIAMLRTVRATMAMRTRAMIASMVIGLHCCRSGRADVLRLPPSAARVDRDQPRFDPEMHSASIRVTPGPMGFQNSAPVLARDGALVFVDALALCTAHLDHADARRAAVIWAGSVSGCSSALAAANGAFCMTA